MTDTENVTPDRPASVAALMERAGGLRSWFRDLTAEVVALPDTMRRLREGASNFELVSRRLAASTTALEEMTKLYTSTVVEPARQSLSAIDTVRADLDALSAGTPSKTVAAHISELQSTLETVARMNPWWRPRTPAERSGDTRRRHDHDAD